MIFKKVFSSNWLNVFVILKSKDRLLNKIYECSPPEPCQAINLMVIGDIGTGKSSFINTLITVFRNNGQQSTLASAHERVSHTNLFCPGCFKFVISAQYGCY